MNKPRERLHALVDLVDENGIDVLYNVMIRFIPEDNALPDEIDAHKEAVKEYEQGEVVKHEEIDWDAPPIV